MQRVPAPDIQLDAPQPSTLVIGLYLLVVATPWLIINQQEIIRYSSAPERLWPLYTVITALLYIAMMTLGFLWIGGGGAEELSCEKSHVRTLWIVLGIASLGAVYLFLKGLYAYYNMVWLLPVTLYADMLPLIESALRDFWRDGVFPYRDHHMPGYVVSLTFFPGLWLPFSIPDLFHADIRLLNVASLAGIMAIFLCLAWQGGTWSWRTIAFRIVPLLAVPCLLRLPTFERFLQGHHLGGHWFALTLWGASYLAKWPIIAGIALGFAMGGRPYLAAIVPVLMIVEIHRWQSERRIEWRFWLSLAITGCLLVVPFMAHDPAQFFRGLSSGYKEQLAPKVHNEPWRTHGLGFSGLLHYIGAYDVRAHVAVILLAPVYTLAWFRRSGGERMGVFFSAFVLFVALGLTFLPWFYIFVDVFLLLSLPSLWLAQTTANRWLVPVALGTFSLVLAATMAATFYRPMQVLKDSGDTESSKLLDLRLAHDGFHSYGWVGNNEQERLKVGGEQAYLALPVDRTSYRMLLVDIDFVPPESTTVLVVDLNFERLATFDFKELAPGTIWVPVPPKLLHHGSNTLVFRLWQAERPLTQEDIAALNLTIGPTTLIDIP